MEGGGKKERKNNKNHRKYNFCSWLKYKYNLLALNRNNLIHACKYGGKWMQACPIRFSFSKSAFCAENVFSLQLCTMSPSLNSYYFAKQKQSAVLHKGFCLHCAVGNEQLEIIQKSSMFQRVNHSFGCNFRRWKHPWNAGPAGCSTVERDGHHGSSPSSLSCLRSQDQERKAENVGTEEGEVKRSLSRPTKRKLTAPSTPCLEQRAVVAIFLLDSALSSTVFVKYLWRIVSTINFELELH